MTHESRRAAVNEEDVAVVLHCVVLRVAGVDIESVVRLPRRWRDALVIVAIFGLVTLSGYARQGCKLRESIILATILAVGSYVAFVWALNLQFPVWPSFITG